VKPSFRRYPLLAILPGLVLLAGNGLAQNSETSPNLQNQSSPVDSSARNTIETCPRLEPVSEVPGKTVIRADGSFCFECYGEYNRRLVEWLEELKGIQARYANEDSPSHSLERLEDFRISSTGMLIHEVCFEPDRFEFDVERAVVDALVQTFTEFIDLETDEVENWTGEPTAISSLHVPGFVSLYSSDNWHRCDSLYYEYRQKGRNAIIEGNENSIDPCGDLRDLTTRYQIDMKESCSFASEIEKGRPKLFCAVGELDKIYPDETSSTNAYASNPTKPKPLIKNHQGKSTIYQQPYIVFNGDRAKDFSATRFQSTLIHEHFHNFGWEDYSQQHNSYSYFCQVAAFYRLTHEDVLNDEQYVDGIEGCIAETYNDRSPSIAGRISDRIVGDKD
jgi:hypothetical protein